MLSLGIQVKYLVSDRAKALVSMGNTTYLDVFSMPDLFHFAQDIGKGIGCHIARRTEQAREAMTSAKEDVKASLTAHYEHLADLCKSYRQQIEAINKSVHPFGEDNKWTQQAVVEKNLIACFSTIGKLAETIEIDIAVEKASKILSQINPIAEGIQQWINQTKAKLDGWTAAGILGHSERIWLEQYALPCQYWEKQYHKTQARLKNKELRQYYKDRWEQAMLNVESAQTDISDSRKEELWKMAYRIAISFQRASSQVEGRNGYLSFVNHAQKGFSKQRLKVLTVIHNYDIRRSDGTTPAQRLFDKEFPDLFEFLCQTVTDFKEPRKRKHKSLNNRFVRR